MKAAELVEILRGHYLAPNRPPGGVFASEIGSPDGRRRADALWMPLTTSGGTELIGHEIKVSRADVLVELQDPTKAEPWMQYCGRWWLVVASPDLVLGLHDQIPASWGILAPPSGRRRRTMTVLRDAPDLRPRNPAPGLQRLLAWSFYRQHEAVGVAERRVESLGYQLTRAREDLADARAAAQGTQAGSAVRRAMELVTRIEKASVDAGLWGSLDDDLVVEAVVGARALAMANQAAARQLARLDEALADPLGYARTHVAKAIELVPVRGGDDRG